MKIDMEKEFAPYPDALELKSIGFDEPCFKYIYVGDTGNNYDHFIDVRPSESKNYNEDSLCVSQPTFSQAFRWFREKYVLFHSIVYLDDNSGDGEFSFEILNKKGNQQQNGEYFEYNSYEEAELACLRKLIEIVKRK